MIDVVLSIVVLSAAALLAGAVYLWRKKDNVKQASLMAILAFVMLVNVVIWTSPNESGATLSDSAATP